MSVELPNIAAYAYQDVHVWSALLTCLRPHTPQVDSPGPKATAAGMGVSTWACPANGEGSCPPPCGLHTEQ